MSNQKISKEQRIADLEEFAEQEGLTLATPAWLIVFLEDRGRIVNLVTGKVYLNVTVVPTASGKAVSHLLADAVGEVML